MQSPESRPAAGQKPEKPGSRPDYAELTVRALRAGLRMQSIAAMLLAGMLLLKGPIASYSALFGSLAAYLPGALFVLLVARKLGGDTNAFLRTAALAEFGKLFLTGLLCAVVFTWVKPLAAGWFFTGMLTVMVMGWVGLGRAIK
ncbi:MAG: ATP synthase subunit I [Xanthomonadales bacterium]|nr:ATP synthase subunit I [Xanthomonadales bacterium]